MLLSIIIIGYLFGSISSAVITCKLMGLKDPRASGSGNPGATNVLRIGGKKAALFTLLGDVLKGLVPVSIALLLGLKLNGAALVALAAFLGHLYPVFFKFQGGKGVATLIGCLFALYLPVGIYFLTTWILVAIVFRYSSLASLVAGLSAPIYMWCFSQNMFATFIVAIMTLFLIIRHRDNMKRLMKGTESKIGKKS